MDKDINDIVVISNTSGQYWTGTCWGVRQAAVEVALCDAEAMDLPGLEAEREESGYTSRVVWYSEDDEIVAATKNL